MRLSDQIREEMEDGRIVVAPDAKLFPTPSAAVMNDGESAESWNARNERLRDKGYNGNGMGMPLTIAVQTLLPTPTTSNEYSNQRNGRGEDLLPGVAERLLPTPTAGDHDRGVSTTREGGQMLTDAVTLLPTPTAALADGGQASRSGDRNDELLLSGIAVQAATRSLLPTPLTDPDTGNGHARHLSGEIKKLPTPTTSMAQGNDRRGGDRADELLLAGIAIEAASRTLLPTPNAALATSGPDHARAERGAGGDDLATKVALLPTTTAMDSEASGNGSGVTLTDVLQRGRRGPVSDIDWGEYEPAIRQWEAVTGRPAPSPVRFDGRDGKPRLSPEFTEWMMGWPAGWITDPRIGLTRAQALRAAGNGVVTLQAIAAIRELLSREGVPDVRAA